MVAKPLRTKPKSASADRCLRSLGATIDMATPDMETSNCSCERRIVAWRFTKRQPGGRGDYWVLSLSGNCCPLGIPVIHDRGTQALAKLALEPEWEAQFEPNSFGFRPGRSCQDAIRHIYNVINLRPSYVL